MDLTDSTISWAELLLTILVTTISSGGVWAFLGSWIDKRHTHSDARTKLLLAIGQYRISYLADWYIGRGWITKDEYEDLIENMYAPYIVLGGNGTTKKLVRDVMDLPIRPSTHPPDEAEKENT